MLHRNYHDLITAQKHTLTHGTSANCACLIFSCGIPHFCYSQAFANLQKFIGLVQGSNDRGKVLTPMYWGHLTPSVGHYYHQVVSFNPEGGTIVFIIPDTDQARQGERANSLCQVKVTTAGLISPK